MLKGGYAMELRVKAARTTRDIDLALLRLAVPSSERVLAAFAPGYIRGATGPELELTKGVGAQLVTEIRALVETAGQDLFQVGNLP